jgi:hypothetical protein
VPRAPRDLATQALSGAYPQRSRFIAYETLLPSPDGQWVAASLSQIESGDAEQLWVFDTCGTRAVRVGDEIAPGRVGLRVVGFRWASSGVLDACFLRINWTNQSENRAERLHVDVGASRTTVGDADWDFHGCPVEYEASRTGQYEVAIERGSESKGFLVDVAKRRRWPLEGYPARVAWNDTHLVVYFDGPPMTRTRLVAYDLAAPQPIEVAGVDWSLRGFALDPRHPQVAYIKDRAVAVYDLRLRRVTKRLSTPFAPGTLGWTATGSMVVGEASSTEATHTPRLVVVPAP